MIIFKGFYFCFTNFLHMDSNSNSELFSISLPNQSSFKSLSSQASQNADTIKEFRSMFLEKYLENNRIGRKSKCSFKNKAKSINNLNSFNSYMQRKIINKSCDILTDSQNQDTSSSSYPNYKYNLNNHFDHNRILDDNSDNNGNLFTTSFDSTFVCHKNSWNYANTESDSQDREDQRNLYFKNKVENNIFEFDAEENVFPVEENLQICNINNLKFILPSENNNESSSYPYSDFDEGNFHEFLFTKNKVTSNLLKIPCSTDNNLINSTHDDSIEHLSDSIFSNNNNNNNNNIPNTENQSSFISVNEWLSVDFNFN